MKKERKKDDSDGIVIDVNYGVASFMGFIHNSKTSITRIRGSRRLLPPFKGAHLEQMQTRWPIPIELPKGKALGFHMVG
jgi:hypothetical protein